MTSSDKTSRVVYEFKDVKMSTSRKRTCHFFGGLCELFLSSQFIISLKLSFYVPYTGETIYFISFSLILMIFRSHLYLKICRCMVIRKSWLRILFGTPLSRPLTLSYCTYGIGSTRVDPIP